MSGDEDPRVPAPRLQHLFAEKGTSMEKYISTVIVVPTFDVTSVMNDSWQDGWKNCWLETRLPKMMLHPCVFSLEPGLQPSNIDKFSWQDVLRWGDGLMEQLLQQLRIDPGFHRRPMILIAHGLGGLVLKRTIGVLLEKFYDLRYRKLLSTIAGLILLGVPNPRLNNPRELENVNTLLRATCRLSKKALDRAAASLSVTANISQKFSDGGFDGPILSVYETKASRAGRNVFSPRQVLVDRSLCETMAARERLFGYDSTHEDLCSINIKSARNLEAEITNLISLALELRDTDNRSPLALAHTSFDAWTRRRSGSFDVTNSVDGLSVGEDGLFSVLGLSESCANDREQSRHTVRSSQVKLPCYLLSSQQRNADFKEREDILAILDNALLPINKYSPAQSRLKTFALCGVGGLGKTEIAIEYTYRRMAAYDAIFWIHAADNARLANDFAQVAIRLGLGEGNMIQDQTLVRKMVLEWLSMTSRKSDCKWLLVFDNARNLSDLKGYWPMNGTGSILITSRDPLAKTLTYFSSPHGLDLQPFSKEDSARWLRDLTGYNMPEDIHPSEIIAEKLSRLPLAIAQVGSAVLRQCLSFSEFLQYYESEQFRKEIYQSHYRLDQPVWAIFAFKELGRATTSLLHVICFLDPDAICESLFPASMGSAKGLNLSITEFPTETVEYINARTELLKSSLVRRNVESKELTVHRIVQDSAICTMDTERLVAVFRSTLHLLSVAWPSGDFDYKIARWKECEALYPHIVHLKMRYLTSRTLQETYDFNTEFGTLVAAAAWYVHKPGFLEYGSYYAIGTSGKEAVHPKLRL